MPSTIRHTVAAALRAELARAGITQSELAKRIGKQQWWVSYRATGRVPCDVEDLALIATALGVPVSRFLNDQPNASGVHPAGNAGVKGSPAADPAAEGQRTALTKAGSAPQTAGTPVPAAAAPSNPPGAAAPTPEAVRR